MSTTNPKPDFQLSYRLPYILLGGAVVLGWLYLGAMVLDMIARMDMGEMGPGMELFNQFNMFKGLPEHVRMQLASLCLPLAQEAFGMPGLANMGLYDYFLLFVMWFMMVLAMMLPSAMPMLQTYHEARGDKSIYVVAVGYLSVWAAFSAVATVAQGVLHQLGVLSPMMLPVFSTLTITTVFAAAIYQLRLPNRPALTGAGRRILRWRCIPVSRSKMPSNLGWNKVCTVWAAAGTYGAYVCGGNHEYYLDRAAWAHNDT